MPLSLPVLSPELFTSELSLLHRAGRTAHGRQGSSASATSWLPEHRYHSTAETRLEIRPLAAESPFGVLEKTRIERMVPCFYARLLPARILSKPRGAAVLAIICKC